MYCMYDMYYVSCMILAEQTKQTKNNTEYYYYYYVYEL